MCFVFPICFSFTRKRKHDNADIGITGFNLILYENSLLYFIVGSFVRFIYESVSESFRLWKISFFALLECREGNYFMFFSDFFCTLISACLWVNFFLSKCQSLSLIDILFYILIAPFILLFYRFLLYSSTFFQCLVDVILYLFFFHHLFS